jgi:glycosyltransferase involved in cell wall biosynthesis
VNLSIVIPALNEAESIEKMVPALLAAHSGAEVIVVDDGSSDGTGEVAARCGATVVTHPYRKGNGAAVKSGARAARGDVLVFLDADGQHQVSDVARLLSRLDEGYDMVIGARNAAGQASIARSIGNGIYNRLASWIVNRPVADLTSGFRVVRASQFKEFLPLFPNGFSYPTTVTMAFFRAGYSVDYLPVEMPRREGKSHLNVVRDGARFALIIFRVGTLYSPLKLFAPFSALFALGGIGNYVYTFAMSGRFTNMSALMLVAAMLVFLIGLVSEQIVLLLYKRD